MSPSSVPSRRRADRPVTGMGDVPEPTVARQTKIPRAKSEINYSSRTIEAPWPSLPPGTTMRAGMAKLPLVIAQNTFVCGRRRQPRQWACLAGDPAQVRVKRAAAHVLQASQRTAEPRVRVFGRARGAFRWLRTGRRHRGKRRSGRVAPPAGVGGHCARPWPRCSASAWSCWPAWRRVREPREVPDCPDLVEPFYPCSEVTESDQGPVPSSLLARTCTS